jgi:hypothetical protein
VVAKQVKVALQKKHSMPNKKRRCTKRVPIHKFKQNKKDVKVATSQDIVFSYCRA